MLVRDTDFGDRLMTALERRVLGPAVSQNIVTGMASARFNVEAPDAQAALENGIVEFVQALGELQITHSGFSEIHIEPADQPDDEHVTGAEIGRRLGVSRERVRRWAHHPRLRFPASLGRIGVARVSRWRDVEAWMQRRGERRDGDGGLPERLS